MNLRRLIAVTLLMVCWMPVYAQRGRRGSGGGGATATAQPMRGLIVGIHGTIKQITKKSIMLEADDGRMFTVRLSGKTKYAAADDKPVKPKEVDIEMAVSIEMTEDNDSKLTAVLVKLDADQKAHAPKTRQ